MARNIDFDWLACSAACVVLCNTEGDEQRMNRNLETLMQKRGPDVRFFELYDENNELRGSFYHGRIRTTDSRK